MFTGLIQAVGTIELFQGSRLMVDAGTFAESDPIVAGESIAVNGCCLTALEHGVLAFDLSAETIARTAFHELRSGSKVNLERAMRPMDRLGGHIVQGHVDSVGEVVAVLQDGEFTVFRFRTPKEMDRYMIDKGSIAVDGISLTIVHPVEGEFDVWVVPHTLEHTNLSSRKPGDLVNLEFDVLAKYVEKLVGGNPRV